MGKLLVIDAEASTRALLKLYLERCGHEVWVAENGHKGLEAFEEIRPAIVFVAVAAKDSMELLRRMKGANPDTEVVVMTGQEEMAFAIEALQYDASDFLCKPISNLALNVALRRALDKISLRARLRDYVAEIQSRYDFEHNLIESSMDGIIANDRQGNIIIFNQGASRIYGYTRDEALYQLNATALYPAGEARNVKKLIHSAEYGGPGRLINYETRGLTKDQQPVPILLSATLIHEGSEEVAAVGYFKDLTEIKRLEQESLQNARMAAIGHAMTEVAHGVKNILYGMKLGGFIVEKGLSGGEVEQISKGWSIVGKNIERISRLTLDMLSYTRREPAPLEPASLNDLVNEVCDLLAEPAQQRSIVLVRELASDLPHILLDPQGLHTCLLNLITNAVEAFPESSTGGRIVVRTGLSADQRIFCTVADTGKGMSQEVQQQIFQPLFTTKGARGTGLGLPITQKIVQEHGGTIEVRSHPSQGTTITLYFPYSNE
jgi:two-component system, NtrC family, sensor kinase